MCVCSVAVTLFSSINLRVEAFPVAVSAAFEVLVDAIYAWTITMIALPHDT
jgi:hypothetical protein